MKIYAVQFGRATKGNLKEDRERKREREEKGLLMPLSHNGNQNIGKFEAVNIKIIKK
jgi:hypothetical protein